MFSAVLCCVLCGILQASGPATIYFMGIAMGNEKLGWSQTLKVAVVCTGVAIASYGDISLSLVGFVLQVCLWVGLWEEMLRGAVEDAAHRLAASASSCVGGGIICCSWRGSDQHLRFLK